MGQSVYADKDGDAGILPMTGKSQPPDLVAAAEAAKAALIKAEGAALAALSALVDKWEKIPSEPIIHVIARMPARERDAATELLHLVAPFAPSLQHPE